MAATSRVMAQCGELACQKNSYLKTLSASVISCVPRASTTTPVSNKGKKNKTNKAEVSSKLQLPRYEVILDDTVLFPEGGGQPCDIGKVGNMKCIQVENVNGSAVHIVEEEDAAGNAIGLLEIGSMVDVEVNWPRRWDHMTQHSTQHLVTAIALKEFGFETLSWNLGELTSFLELNTVEFSDEHMARLEMLSNEAIRRGHAVVPSWHDASSVNNGEVPGLRMSSKKLPDSVTGPVRVISFEGIDTNTCCGTHVASTAHLQAIKLLKVETSSKNKSCKVFFIAGDRVLKFIQESFMRETQLVSKLCVGPSDIPSRVDDILAKQRSLEKAQKLLTAEVVKLTAASLIRNAASSRVLLHHRTTQTSADFGKLLAMELEPFLNASPGRVLALTISDEASNTSSTSNNSVNGGGGGGGVADSDSGTFLVAGPPVLVSAAGVAFAAVVNGRGGGKGDKYQGKCSSVGKHEEAIDAAEEAIKDIII